MKDIARRSPGLRGSVSIMIVVFSLAFSLGAPGCGGGGSSGPGSWTQDKTEECPDLDDDGFYAEEGCGTRLDCNDRDPSINPRATEYCVGVDNDCDGLVDEDCLAEVCDDGLDNDGDGVIDEACRWGTSFVSDTGQTRCYDNDALLYPCPSPGEGFFGQDACYASADSPFTKLDAGGGALTRDALNWTMVRDNITGLIWEVKTDDDTIHDKNISSEWIDAAGAYIDQLNAENFGGYSDWRLPSVKELFTIVNLLARDPAVDSEFFPFTMNETYWSSTPLTANDDYVWIVDFGDAAVFKQRKIRSARIRAVRGNRLSPTYIDNNDGTITATVNNRSLMWARDSSLESMFWEEALTYCENLGLAGYSDWRLPNIKELRTLVDYSTSQPAIDVNFFPDTHEAGYWSSTTCIDGFGEAWAIGFSAGGSQVGSDKTYDYHKSFARAVRGGQ